MPRKTAAAQIPAPTADSTQSLLRLVVKALDDKKATDLRVLKVAAQSSITDYLVVATGNAEPHLRALRVELEKVLDGAHAKIAGMEIGDGSGWLVVDAYQIMIHLFLPTQRETYRLEQLWRDAEDLKVAELLEPPPPKAKAARKAAPKAPSKKTTVKKAGVSKAVPKKKAR
jgi:ribosome-associated protein